MRNSARGLPITNSEPRSGLTTAPGQRGAAKTTPSIGARKVRTFFASSAAERSLPLAARSARAAASAARAFVSLVRALTTSLSETKPRGSKRTVDTLIYGVASHDVYHTGQIQILKRLWKGRKKSR